MAPTRAFDDNYPNLEVGHFHHIHVEKPIRPFKISLNSGRGNTIRMDYLELIKGFVLSPAETFRNVKDTGYRDTLMYFLALVVINTVLTIPVMLLTFPSGGTLFVGVFQRLGFGTLTGFGNVLFAVMMIIGSLVCLFIGAAWVHLWVYLFGGRKGYRETLKAVAFGDTPALLFGWIPLVGMLAGFWSLFISILGIRELQEISTNRALGALILAVLVPLFVLIVLAAFLFIAYTGTGPVSVFGS
jgi:Yip1 domain